MVSQSALDFTARAQTATHLGSPLGSPQGFSDRQLSQASLPASSSLPRPSELRSELRSELSQSIADPDLGILRLRRSPPDSEGDTPPPIKPLPANCDPELGCLRLREPLPLPPLQRAAPRAPVLYLIARGDYFRNSNLFSNLDPQADGLSRPGLTLYTSPSIGPNTYLVASATANLLRYSAQSQLNADELFFRAGILQRLSPTMFGEIGWSNQQLFVSGDKLLGLPAGTRFLSEHAIRLELSRRDRLSQKLSLSSFYQFRYGFADPIDRSRLTHTLSLSLNYDLQPNLQLGLDYQLGWASFTQQNRRDSYNQVLGRLTYTPLRNTQVSAFVGYGFGNSTDQSIRFNNLLLGVSVSLTLGLF